MSAIRAVVAKEILDSQGNPTISVAIWTDDGFMVESSIPNGEKVLPHEAQILLDLDPAHKNGKGVQKAVQLINQQIASQLVGKDPVNQEELDRLLLELDGTELKTQLGANTIAAVSQALFKAGAAAMGQAVYQRLFEQYRLCSYLKIPTCIFGLINGGKYGSNNLDLQEFLIIPASHMDYRVSLEIEDDLRNNLLALLKNRRANYSTGILGGFTPALQKNTDVFDFIIEAAHKTDYILSRDFFFGLDAGAENLVDRGKYILRDRSTVYSEKEILEFYKGLKEKYNVNYMEDPFTIKNTSLWKELTDDIGNSTRIVLDSITVSNSKKIQEAVQNNYGNSVIIKPSQIGTVTEAIQAVKTAKDAGWSVIVSQRSGETNDNFLADFAVGIGADFIKFGPTNRGESVEKYNRLADIYLEIEQQMLEGESNMNPNPPQDTNLGQPTGDQTQSTATEPVATTMAAAQTPTPAATINPFIAEDQTIPATDPMVTATPEVAPTPVTMTTPIATATPEPVVTPVTSSVNPFASTDITPPITPEPVIPEPIVTPVTPTPVPINIPAPTVPTPTLPVNSPPIVTTPITAAPVETPVVEPVANLTLGQTQEVIPPMVSMGAVDMTPQPPMNTPVVANAATNPNPAIQPVAAEPKEEVGADVVQEAIDSTLAELSPNSGSQTIT